MKIAKGTIALFGVAALMLLAVACSHGEAADTPNARPETTAPSQSEPVQPSTGQPEPVGAVGAPGSAGAAPAIEPSVAVASQGVPPPPASAPVVSIPALPMREPAQMPRSAMSGAVGASFGPLLQAAGSQSGIWVTGEGSISLDPDLALINIGVETRAASVAQARNEAANAMAAIVAAVKAHGLTDRDIQTRSFNIWPQYEYPEVLESGVRTRKQTLVGYMVSNSASIKVRDLDAVGDIIDDVADAGGDATRINGISFTVEDPKPFMVQLREEAVQDALAKARHFADLTGVAVGRLVFISESGGGRPIVQNFMEERAFAVAAAPAPTSISGGELELRLFVRAVFDIQ